MSLETREINTTEFIHLVDSSSMADYCRNVMLFFASLVLASTFIQEVSAQDVSKVAPVSADPTLQPWLAQVTGKSVNVRTGPSTNHFAFSRLTMDTPVIAMGGKGDWVALSKNRHFFFSKINKFPQNEPGRLGGRPKEKKS